MNVAEARALQTAMDHFVRRFDERHRFTAEDVRDMHRTWLGVIYEWERACAVDLQVANSAWPRRERLQGQGIAKGAREC